MDYSNILSTINHDAWSKEHEQILMEPYAYLTSTPGKEIRTKLIEAFNLWLDVSDADLEIITRVVRMLHTGSLLMDDVEDDSQLRRGIPVAHKIYGIPQTINSANYIYFLAYQELFKFRQPWRTRPASASASAGPSSSSSSDAGGGTRSPPPPRSSSDQLTAAASQSPHLAQMNGHGHSHGGDDASLDTDSVPESNSSQQHSRQQQQQPRIANRSRDRERNNDDYDHHHHHHSRSSSFAEQLGSVAKRQEVRRALYEGRSAASQHLEEVQQGKGQEQVSGDGSGAPRTTTTKSKGKEKLDVFLDEIITEELLNLHRGQGLDLFWRDTLTCPTEEEYIQMVLGKTGGLFRIAVKLMMARSTSSTDYVPLVNLISIYFQVRDDYMNLQSTEYTENKGYCEDLTEGKFSFPVVHAVRTDPSNRQILNILQKRTDSNELKRHAVSIMRDRTHSFEYTMKVLRQLEKQVVDEVARLGGNPLLEAIVDHLSLPRES